MHIKFYITFLFVIAINLINAQTNTLRINPNIRLPKDSITAKVLLFSANEFILSCQKPNEENKWIDEKQKAETFLLLDELKGMERNAKFNDDFFYKPYLNNVVMLDSSQYLIQLSYLGFKSDSVFLRANFQLLANRSNNSFRFSSPILNQTKNWKSIKTGNTTFHYETKINKAQVKRFGKLTEEFDKKLKASNKQVEYYCSDNIVDALKLTGIDYKMDYNGRTQTALSASYENKKVIILGLRDATFNNFDSHDLWHDRLSLVVKRADVNRAVDEGCAYLYGGSWGFSWQEIYEEFKKQIVNNKNPNWKELKENPIYFNTKTFKNSADYIVNALLVEKIEREKGFEGVWEFLNCGKVEKGNENYYQVLEKLTGISKANYNDKIWELVNSKK